MTVHLVVGFIIFFYLFEGFTIFVHLVENFTIRVYLVVGFTVFSCCLRIPRQIFSAHPFLVYEI
jgi:hypothetical protein